ncbi:MAG: DUF5057 domain-containing protein [Lachnospiraceae bacterium]|nr:DUF5057 domain-containing protein [Candidatus Colinaster equi]
MSRFTDVLKNKITIATIAVITAGAVVGGTVYFNSMRAEARMTLPGIQTIIDDGSNNTDPFVILEVVGNKADASLGYLVEGEEPINDDAMSIKDMPTKAERSANIPSDYGTASGKLTGGKGAELIGKAFNYTDAYDETGDDQSIDIRGEFVENTASTGYYNKNDAGDGYAVYNDTVDGYISIDGSEEHYAQIYDAFRLYRKMYKYDLTGDGGYYFGLEKLSSDDLPMVIDTDANGDIYNWQYFEAYEITADNYEGIDPGQVIYTGTADNMDYYGKVVVDDSDPEHPVNKVEMLDSTQVEIASLADDGYYVGYVSGNDGSSEYYKLVNPTAAGGAPYACNIDFTAVDGDHYDEVNLPASHTYYYVADDDAAMSYVYAPSHDGAYDFKADYTQEVYQTFSFSGGFTNNEWFKTEVLDIGMGAKSYGDYDESTISQLKDTVIDVKTVTVDELGDYLDSAKMVYLAGGYTTDIDAEVARTLHNKVVNDDFPIVMEYSAYKSAADNSLENMQKLALKLMQSDLKSVDDAAAWTALNIGDDTHGLLGGLRFGKMSANNPETKDISFVSGTIFVNDDLVCGSIVSADFAAEYSKEKGKYGGPFTEMIDENDEQRVYIEQQIATSGGEDTYNYKLSKATTIRHILNARNVNVGTKSELNILDIEPYDCTIYGWDDHYYKPSESGYAKLQTLNKPRSAGGNGENNENAYKNINIDNYKDYFDKDWFTKNVATQFNSDSAMDKVHVSMMGTAEFIGNQEELGEHYDVVYIGLDTTMMNTRLTSNDRVKTERTEYNDDSMNDLVYTHMGDKTRFNVNYQNKAVNKGAKAVEGTTRFSGNDITYDKYCTLKRYVEAGYALMLSDRFFTSLFDINEGTINTDVVDESSWMYTFIKDVCLAKDGDTYLYLGKNVNTDYTLENNSTAKNMFVKFMNYSSLKIDVKEKPTEYVMQDGSYQFLQPNGGAYFLDFTVDLKMDSLVSSQEEGSTGGATYDCILYVDVDKDGKYEESELEDGLVVTKDGSEEGTEDGKYHLTAGNQYHISKQLPDEYVGMVSWKLAFVMNDKKTGASSHDNANSIRTAVTGFSAVPAANGVQPSIKVLQLTSSSDVQHLDLTSSVMKSLYDQTEYDIQVTKRSVSDLVDNWTLDGLSRTDYLCSFDIVVLGFDDSYSLESKNNYPADAYYDAVMAIREYVLSGRSILFTHDLTSPYEEQNDVKSRAWYLTTYLRDVMGMDRYGVTDGRLRAKGTENRYVSVFDEAKVDGKDASGDYNKSAFSDFVSSFYISTNNNSTDRRANNNEYAMLARTELYSTFSGEKATSVSNMYTTGSKKVNRLNQGQITQYPFNIDETIAVAETHCQWYQLNLDTKSDDENDNDDVVVWYALDGKASSEWADNSYCSVVKNDARNNYYIYNKGNITYTGAGHSEITSGAQYDSERKLFVNTLIASYEAGEHAPKVIYKESPFNTSATITSMYLPYDPTLMATADTSEENEGGYLDKNITVNFRTFNGNLKGSKNPLNAKYYVQVGKSDPHNLTIGKGDEAKYYAEISPSSFKMVESTGAMSDVGAGVLNNYTIYQGVFSLKDLRFGENKVTKDNATLYVRLGTESLQNGEFDVEPATESLSPLGIYSVKLFELK